MQVRMNNLQSWLTTDMKCVVPAYLRGYDPILQDKPTTYYMPGNNNYLYEYQPSGNEGNNSLPAMLHQLQNTN